MKPPKTYVIFSMLVTLALLAVSCSRSPSSTKFYTVLDGGYDPVTAFRKQGYTVHTEAGGEGVSNAEYGYRWVSWCGILTGTQKRPDCAAIAVLIRDKLNRALGKGSADELTDKSSSAGQPLTGMLQYNKDSVHGDVHVWLMPNATNAEVNYVIFVREERLK